MTGLDVLAVAVGSTVGAALGVRAWRQVPDNRADRVAAEGESAQERDLHQQCDSIIVRLTRRADEGSVDRLSLDRAHFFHDIATRAGCPSERSAARSELVAIEKATSHNESCGS